MVYTRTRAAHHTPAQRSRHTRYVSREHKKALARRAATNRKGKAAVRRTKPRVRTPSPPLDISAPAFPSPSPPPTPSSSPPPLRLRRRRRVFVSSSPAKPAAGASHGTDRMRIALNAYEARRTDTAFDKLCQSVRMYVNAARRIGQLSNRVRRVERSIVAYAAASRTSDAGYAELNLAQMKAEDEYNRVWMEEKKMRFRRDVAEEQLQACRGRGACPCKGNHETRAALIHAAWSEAFDETVEAFNRKNHAEAALGDDRERRREALEDATAEVAAAVRAVVDDGPSSDRSRMGGAAAAAAAAASADGLRLATASTSSWD